MGGHGPSGPQPWGPRQLAGSWVGGVCSLKPWVPPPPGADLVVTVLPGRCLGESHGVLVLSSSWAQGWAMSHVRGGLGWGKYQGAHESQTEPRLCCLPAVLPQACYLHSLSKFAAGLASGWPEGALRP